MLEVLHFFLFYFFKNRCKFCNKPYLLYLPRVDESDELLEPRLRERRGSCYKVTATASTSKEPAAAQCNRSEGM